MIQMGKRNLCQKSLPDSKNKRKGKKKEEKKGKKCS